MSRISYQRICADNEIDIAIVRSIYEATPRYFYIVHGYAFDKNSVRDDLVAIPEGCDLDSKYFYAIYLGTEAIGCIDIIRGYPDQQAVFIGILLFIESQQGLGFGHQALDFINELTSVWGSKRLRIAVVESNERALSFWLREGFIELYRKNSIEYNKSVIVMERINSLLDETTSLNTDK